MLTLSVRFSMSGVWRGGKTRAPVECWAGKRMEMICLAHIRIGPSRKMEFDRLYSVWKCERERSEVPPNGFLLIIGLPTPLDHVPGKLEYCGVEDEFLDVLRSKQFLFELV